MANPILAQVSETQSRKAQAVNENFQAVQAASLYGVDKVNSTGLVFAYYGGPLRNGSSISTIAAGTLTLTASNTCYIERTLNGVVSFNTSSFTAGYIPLYSAVVDTNAISTVTDCRIFELSRYLSVNTTPVGTFATGEDNLMTFGIPANSCSAGRVFRVTAWGLTASNNNAKTLKMYWGSTAILTQVLTVSQVNTWRIVAEICIITTDSQRYVAHLTQAGTTTLSDVEQGTSAQDDGATITIKCTGEIVGSPQVNDEILQNGMIIEPLN